MSRDALIRLHNSLEDQLPGADESARVRLERELDACRQALEWDETRAAGRHHFVWRGGKVIPLFLISSIMPMVLWFNLADRPSTSAVVLAGLFLAAGFGGCIAVLYRGWTAAERRYAAQLEKARLLPANRSGAALDDQTR